MLQDLGYVMDDTVHIMGKCKFMSIIKRIKLGEGNEGI